MPKTEKLALEIEIRKIGRGLEQVQQELKRLSGSVEREGLKIRKAAERMDREFAAVGKTIRRLTAAFAALAGTAALGALGRSFVRTASDMERYQTVLATVLHDTDEARRLMEELERFASKTPFNLDELTQAAVRLEAYGISTERYLETLGDAAAALGKPIMAAVEMIADAAQGEFERLKEFGLRGIDLARQAGFATVQEMTATREGLLLGTQALMELLQQRYAGGMEELSKTFGGMVSNLKDYWTKFKKLVMESGPFEWIKERLQDLLDWLERSEMFGDLERWAKDIGTGVTNAFNAVYNVVSRVVRAVQQYIDKLRASRDPMRQFSADVTKFIVGALGPAITELALDLSEWAVSIGWDVGESIVKGIVDGFKQMIFARKKEIFDALQGALGGMGWGDFEGMSSEYDITFNAKIKASPERPFSEGIEYIRRRLRSLASEVGMAFDFSALTGSSIPAVMSAVETLRRAKAALERAQEFARWYGNNLLTSMLSQVSTVSVERWRQNYLAPYYEQVRSAEMQLMAQYAASARPIFGSAGGAFGGRGGGVTVNVGPVTVNVGEGAGEARDLAIGVADRLDEEIASKIRNERSKIPAALEAAGYL